LDNFSDWIISWFLSNLINPILDWVADVVRYFDFFSNSTILGGWLQWVGDLLQWIADLIVDIGGWLESDEGMAILIALLSSVVLLMIMFINILNIIWMERKLAGRLMDRRGPKNMGVWNHGYLQNIIDAVKAFIKEIITPHKADWFLYHLAPIILIASSILIVAAIPHSSLVALTDLQGGIFFVMAAFAIAPLGVLTGGWASNNKYTLIGGMRGAAQMMSYEIPLLLSLTAVVVFAGSFNPREVVEFQHGLNFGERAIYMLVMIPSILVFLIGIAAETERQPFDLPEAPSELVEGWTTEYGGMRFALMFMTEYIRLYAGICVAVLLFFGGWYGPYHNVNIIWFIDIGLLWFVLKVYILSAVFIWARWSLPRVRTDQILFIGWKRLLPISLVGVLIAAMVKAAGEYYLGWF